MERSGSELDLRPTLRTFLCPRRQNISALPAGNRLIRTQRSAAGNAVRCAYGVRRITVIAGQPAQSLREIVRKAEGLSSSRNRLPDAGCELQRGDVLGEVVQTIHQ